MSYKIKSIVIVLYLKKSANEAYKILLWLSCYTNKIVLIWENVQRGCTIEK